MICIHHNDLDGRCAAAIVYQRFKTQDVKFIKIDYKDAENTNFMTKLIESVKDEEVVIVDFSFKPREMFMIEEVAKSITWIDHHATAQDYGYKYPGLRCFEDKKFAGCELTWLYFFPNDAMPLVVALIGDYDKWTLAMSDSIVFYEGMKTIDTDPTNNIWKELFDSCIGKWKEILATGRAAIQYRDSYCRGLCDSFGFETELDGIPAYACNQYMFGSGGFGSKFKEYPMCIAFIYDGQKYTVSLYSETIDVSDIARNHGGGGHKGAAGFTCIYLPFSKQELL